MKHDSVIKNGTVIFPFHGEIKCDISVRDAKMPTAEIHRYFF